MAEPEKLFPEGEGPTGRGESIADATSELIADVGDLFRGEIRLARSEILTDVKTLAFGLALIAVGGLLAFWGVTYLLLAAVFALGGAPSLSIGALIVGVIVLVIGGILAALGIIRWSATNPVPEQTVETLREDAEWLKNKPR